MRNIVLLEESELNSIYDALTTPTSMKYRSRSTLLHEIKYLLNLKLLFFLEVT